MQEECEALIKILTKTKYVLFTSRCNQSIEFALQAAKEEGRSHLLKQEEGGWLTYEKYAKKAGLDVTNMITLDGAIGPRELLNYGQDEVLILNTLAGYVTPLPVSEISSRCIQQDILFINDVSASIGTDLATQGDIIVGSFGPAKPVDLGTGGFMATNNKELFARLKLVQGEPVHDIDFEELTQKLKGLAKRRQFLEQKVQDIRNDLKEMQVMQPDAKHSLNVIVRYDADDEKETILAYCKEHNLEYTECPREIRILDNAISIEVKRLIS